MLGRDWKSKAFTADVQDQLGRAIYEDNKNGDLSKIWAGLPSNKPGAYSNVPWEQARVKIAQVESGGSGNNQPSPVRPALSATQLKIEQKQRETHKVAGAIGSKIDGQIANIDALLNSKGLNEITGNIRGNIPGTLMSIASQGAANALAKYKTIVANATLTELQELKATSPTGGALGAVSDAENQMLRDAAATLDRAQDLQTFKTALIDYKTKLQNAKNRLLRAYEEDFGQAYGAYSGGSSRAAPAKGGGGGWGSAKVVGD